MDTLIPVDKHIPVYFFGYGAYRSKQCIEDVLGTTLADGRGAVVHEYALCYQILSQIPDPPRELLKKIWGDAFRCYTIRPFPKALVAGVVWELTPYQLHHMKEWEYDGIWKKIIQIPVTLCNGDTMNAWTDVILETIPIHEAVDGLYYKNNLNPQGKSIKIEDEFRIQALLKARQELQTFAYLSVKN